MLRIPYLSMILKVQNLLPKFFIFTLLLISATPAKAQITPDNTLGAERSVFTQNTLIQGKGINADLITGGAQRGRNLFHSFTDFNVIAGQKVYFANPSDVTNILTRVTGGNQSKIFGTLGVDGAANLFLINPNGILFGSGASLDLKGSFVGTTANAVQFGNLGSFSATNPQAPPLLTIDPSGLLFNQLHQQGITVNNQLMGGTGTSPNITGLGVPNGKSLLLVGGDVTLDGGALAASGGRVELASLAAPGTVGLNVTGDTLSLSVPSNVQRGNVSLQNQAKVDVSGAGAGDIAVNAGKLDLSNSYLFAENLPGSGNSSTKAGDININADSISLSNGAQIDTFTNGTGNAGNITIVAKGAVTLDGVDANGNRSALVSSVEAGAIGNGGKIDITAGSLSLTKGGQIDTSINSASGSLAAGQGIGGTINVKVGDALTISGPNGSGIFANLDTGARGSAGNIEINTGSLSFKDGAQINSFTAGNGNAGNITITAKNAVSFDGIDSNNNHSALFSSVEAGGVGNGGSVEITAESLSLTHGGEINADVNSSSGNLTNNQGIGGTININVADAFTIAGSGSEISSQINADAIGRAGSITIQSGNLSIKEGGQISSSTFGQGNAGNISITARGQISLDSYPSFIVSNVLKNAVGKAGNISITTDSLSVTNGAQINSFTRGQGDAGNITIVAKDAVKIDGTGSTGPSALFSSVEEAGAIGSGGKIDISTGSLSLTHGGEINTFTLGTGNAGNITIVAKNAVNIDGTASTGSSGLFSGVESGGIGNGGKIDVTAGSFFLSGDGQIVADVNSSSGNLADNQGIGGTISINVADAFTISGSGSQISSEIDTGAMGRGGDIKVQAGNISIKDGGLIITSTSGTGNAGNIFITANDGISLDGSLTGVVNNVLSSGVGNAGNIDINTGSLSVKNGSQINTFTRGKGNAGNITITAKNAVTFDGGSNGYNSAVFSNVPEDSLGLGNSGTINITAKSLALTNGAQLGVSVGKGQGTAGDITIDANSLRLDKGSILAETNSSTDNGNIILNLSDYLFLRHNSVISASAGTKQAGGDGGNIRITTPFVIAVPKENSDIIANAFSGKGGRIDIIGAQLFGIQPSNDPSPRTNQTNDISTRSQLGLPGQINISQPEIELISGLIELPIQVSDAATKFSQLCPNSPNAKPLGEFVITGKGSIPPNPLQLLPGRNPDIPLANAEDMQEIRAIQAQDQKKKEEREHSTKVGRKKNKDNTLPSIVEAQGIVQTPDGQIYFVANANHAIPSSQPTASPCPSHN